jgi:hypothetical protein
MKYVLPVVALFATAFSNSAPSARFPELRLTMETDTLRVHPPKGFLTPTDNLIDSVLALPEEYFALDRYPAGDYGPDLACSEV